MVAAYSRVAIGIEGGAYYGKNDAWVWHLSADERALAGIKEEPSPMDSHIPDEEIHRLNKSPAPYTWPVKKWPGFLPEVESFLAASGYKPEEVLEDDDGNLYDLERRMLIAFPAGIIEMRQKQKLQERANHRPQIIEYLGLMLVQGVLKPFENHLERTGTPAMVGYFREYLPDVAEELKLLDPEGARLASKIALPISASSPPASPPPSPSSASTLAQPETHEVSQAPVTLASSSTIPKKKKSKKVKKAKKQRDKKKAAEIAALSTARSPSRSPSPSPSRLSHVSGILEEAVDCVCASSRPLSTDQSAVHRDCACGVSTLATIRHKSSQTQGTAVHRGRACSDPMPCYCRAPASDAAFESELSYDSVTARAPTQDFGLGSWSAPPSPRASSSALPLPREGPIPAGRPGMRRTFPGISVQVSMAVRGGRKQGDEAVAEDSGWGKGEVALLIEFLH
ncbi:hypothetical protein N7468_005521 [Penicillium chermesinum]|uniref:Uncharacterized protein n=1 Tax=Penicillium chermesinum TaxID=63820 RepID=A0A9W9NZK0_9EURO|nr:uncharacterized protein N7468_005521 [Penicillium chermesinum]KAJ5232565.1 hypothetical protein N7468_005521 [Penicillium chermesinum]